MYGKVFRSIYAGSLHGRWEAIVTMQQLIVLSDAHGEVDMTLEAIAATTSIPLEILKTGIAVLEKPDPFSRTPGARGRRVERLAAHRPWGWRLVNYDLYRQISSEESRRELARNRQRRRRQVLAAAQDKPPVTPCHAASRDVRMSRQVEGEAEGEEMKKKPGRRASARPFTVRLLTSGPPADAGAPAALPLSDRRHEAMLSEETLAECRGLYPGLDLNACLRQMRGWLIAHPTKRKTERGVLAFVHAWLGREQNGYGRSGPGPVQEATPARAGDAAYLEADREARRE